MFTRIAIVNRGEAAVRLIRAVRELNAEHGYGIRTVALHTEAERRAMFVRQADESVTLRPSKTAATPYLDHAELERALRASEADAVWVGWGFVAEDPAFARLCAKLGITFIGPSAEAMALLGDKVEAKLLAEKVGVPVAPWSGGPVDTRADARRHAKAIGYPLIIKARSGGGGRGIRKVYADSELEVALERTQGEAERSFGDPVVFLERLVTDARHVEVQVIADAHGNVWAPGVRDCSIQRKNQKVIEESSSPLLSREQSAELRKVSAELVRAAGYCGAATVEYLYQPQTRTFTFLEVNTRLQVEHPITEATTGLDLVKLQIHVASGQPLVGECPPEFGHAVEARLNAEDAANGFTPAPGAVRLLRFPLGSSLRVDTGIAQGDVIPPDYDSMVAKVIAWGRDRSEALARLRTALRETTVVIEGGTTTKSFLLHLLDREEVVTASADTGWLDRTGIGTSAAASAGDVPDPTAAIALLATAVDVYDAEEAHERAAFRASARGGRPRASHAIGRELELGYQNQVYRLTVSQVGPNRYQVVEGASEHDVEVDRLSEFESRVVVAGRRHHVVSIAGPAHHLVEVDGVSHKVTQDEAGVVRAPAPAVVVAVPVAVGDTVEVGDTLVVLESMKMEAAVRAQVAGRVREVLAIVNSQVDGGAPLLRVEPVGEKSATATSARVLFPQPESVSTLSTLDLLEELRALLTGYDVDAARARTLLARYEGLRAGQGDTHLPAGAVVHTELALLSTFADICEISRNRPISGAPYGDESVHSPREHFHTYLRSLDPDVEGLPESFRTRLARALKHYGVGDLDPTPALAEAVYRLFLALQRMENQIPVVTALLERWLTSSAPKLPGELAEVLDRLITATQLRYPVVGDLARNVRFRIFDEPRLLKARELAHDRVRGSLEYLAENPDAPDFGARVRELTINPEPLIALLAQRTHRPGVLLEAITRSYYKIRTLEDVTLRERDKHQLLTAEFELAGDRLSLVAGVAHRYDLQGILRAIDATTPPDREHLVLDLYLSWPDAPTDSDALSTELAQEVNGVCRVRRVTVTVFGAPARVRQFTFRPVAGQLAEDRIIRDMHPLVGQRLDLWRLKNFNGTPLPSPAGTYLYHLAAKQNPADERFIALAEIRDETPLRDESGRVVAVPSFERTLIACLDGIRRAQAKRGSRKRLEANRVVLYLWPTLELDQDEFATIARNTVPFTVGAGLEEITLIGWLPDGADGGLRKRALRFSYRTGDGVVLTVTDPPADPLAPVDAYTQKVRAARTRGTVYPYELVPLLTGPKGTFIEHDFDAYGNLVPVARPYGENKAGLIVGLVTTPTDRYPEGMTRVALFGDPTKALGTVAEPECSRLVAAIDLAEKMGVPVEWFALSSGAKISMDSGTENMDWVSRGLRRLITFTQGGGEVNVVVAGINVGAQPYWNAEATMLMHTKGILVMTPESAMVLTGKNSLDYSGGVSAEDNFGIGGYDRVMGPNGEAQYWAPNLTVACEILFAHYDHAYVAPGERFPRPALTADPVERDVCAYPHTHPSSDFTTVGDIFSPVRNPERKKPFDIRTVMRAVVDQDHAVLERWADMAGADTSVVFDAHLGGQPVTVLGVESRAIQRKGWFPADGPDRWTAGTLFPASSKKTARAINAASGNRPLVVLANLSGFDGSPESLRNIQLEYGAEIGRAIVNFDGPIVFCVISRYHGGAFVVFSSALNDNMEVIAVEGSFASVIGGAPAAAVVFSREVNARTAADPAVQELEARLAAAQNQADRAHLRVDLVARRAAVRSEKLGEVAAEFEAVHNISRAQQVGSVDAIVPANELRPYLVGAVARGMERAAAK